MITSLLSLYITSSISPNIDTQIDKVDQNRPNIVKTASFDTSRKDEDFKFPIKNPYYIEPIIEARAAIGVDMESGAILYEKNVHESMPIASITKLMTILIILEENDLTETVTISQNAAETPGSQMFLRAGEQIALENLVYGAIIHSANDAAVALSEHNSGSTSAFVEKMNNKAASLGLVNTSFANPTGLDDPNNYSSAYDVAKLAQEVYSYDFIQHAASFKSLEVKSINGNVTHSLESTNDLLDSYLNIKGLKTGKTDAAGLCLVSVAENIYEDEVVTVVLNSPDRFRETKIFTDWLFRAYTW